MESLQAIVAASSKERPTFTHRTQRVDGKVRHITAPNFAMRLLHWQVIDRLRKVDIGILLHNSYGAMRGGSTVSNASRHVHNRYIYQLDITKAYETTSLDRLATALHCLEPTLGNEVEIHDFLLAYCAGPRGGLAVGGPASPALFDLYCASEIDTKIRAVCPRAMYSRYLDDLTISQKEPIPRIMRERIREVLVKSGFTVSHRKSFLTDRHERSVTITGVVLTKSGMIRPTNDFMERVRKMLRRPSSSMTEEERDELHGLAGHLFQFTDQTEWPYRNVSRDVIHLQQRLRGKVGAIPTPKNSRHLFFSRQFLDAVRSVPLEDVVRPYVKKFRKFGNEYQGLCPYHTEKTRSFTVAPTKGFYYCFGCGAYGDVIRFVMEFERCTFPEAVRNIAARYHIQEGW